MTDLEYRLAKKYALRRLSAQSLPAAGLAKALKQRSVSEEIIERLIAEFCHLGYINDIEWIDSYVRGQQSRKKGPKAIAYKLAEKGISTQQAEEVLKRVSGIEQQKEMIINLLSTRYKSKNLSDFKEKQKVIAALVRRGFDLSAILDCIKNGQED